MKIFGYCRPRDFVSRDFSDKFVEIAGRSGIEYRINENYSRFVHKTTGTEIPSYDHITEADIEAGGIMVSMGGDGTFLEAVRSLKGLPMPIMGVNTGRLGFLASINPKDLEEALTEIEYGNIAVEKLTMLTVEGDFGTVPEFPCALNEFTLHRHTADMIEVTAWADGYLLAVIRGDGVIISTPTGSTAYSMSAGGPIAAPQCACFVCTAIAPHNFSVRPLIIPDTSTIVLEVRTRGKGVLASLDNASYIVGDGARFTIRKSEYSTFFTHLQNISFYDTLRDKLMWGLDKRDKAQEKFLIDE